LRISASNAGCKCFGEYDETPEEMESKLKEYLRKV
jgi:hypothetical protein